MNVARQKQVIIGTTHYRVLMATLLSVWLNTVDLQRGHINITVRNTFRNKS